MLFIYIFIQLLILSYCTTGKADKQKQIKCPNQPLEIKNGLYHLQNESLTFNTDYNLHDICIVQDYSIDILIELYEYYNNQSKIDINSILNIKYEISTINTIPSAQTWMYCQNCIYTNKNSFIIF